MKRKTTMTVEEVRGIGRVCRLAERIIRQEGDKLYAVGGALWSTTEVRQHLAFASKLCVKAVKRAKP